jgi:DNA-binding NtrC family response regulator
MAAILVVDDEDGIRRVIRAILEVEGHEIHEAINGEQALARLRAGRFDLAIMDVMMPGKGGLDTLLEIHEEFPRLKVIVVSGRIDVSSPAFQNLASHFGATRILQKPLEPRRLREEVKAMLEESEGGSPVE